MIFDFVGDNRICLEPDSNFLDPFQFRCAMTTDCLLIRDALFSDVDSINRIYNEAIESTTATFDIDRKTVDEQMLWFRSRGERFPILVAEWNQIVVGWSCRTPWSPKTAYDITAETTFYVEQAYRGQGIGRRLKQAIVERARVLGFHSLIARVAQESDASLHLNQSLGFVQIGTLKQVGRKFDKLLDVLILQKILD